MAYDEVLADRIAELVDAEPRKMFGGIGFMERGNMAVGVIKDDLLVRVGNDGMDDALARPGTRPFQMGGRVSKGWVLVDGETLDDEVLDGWIDIGRKTAAALPPK
ncbi:MAG TPA: TfoX/Sxy family protein [Stackebrandtia sp.]|jgi:TfoX/Sxy family transcriptional regulator of competence genes|uniref:TfoX/Sxy family protein n=1 Tax=Stackebrandtia sp. TaxID=2023065 RepID=UPI002D34E77E|nr:TfoX/Sxy family protein [Stackebrandtia sp.]HZE40036.1 TfoX/Sxy family protein [Stackebrandtia sp.]